MQFMVPVKASQDSEAGVMVAGEGLHPGSTGVRIKYSGKNPAVTNGPLAGTEQLVAGFRLIEVKSRDEAVETRAVRWRIRDRDSPGVVRGRFRRRVHARTARPERELRDQEERLRA